MAEGFQRAFHGSHLNHPKTVAPQSQKAPFRENPPRDFRQRAFLQWASNSRGHCWLGVNSYRVLSRGFARIEANRQTQAI